MQQKCYAILTTLIGILLILPLLGVTALGTLTEGILAWAIALAVLIIGVKGLMVVFKK